MPSWLVALIFTEGLIGAGAIACYFAIRVLVGCRVPQRIAYGYMSLAISAVYVWLKVGFLNTGTLVCQTQEFAIDQIPALALGFAVRGLRGGSKTCHAAQIAGVAISAILVLLSILWWSMPNCLLTEHLNEWRNQHALR